MTPELERAVKRYRQWFGSYKNSGELIKVQVWLTVNNGCIEFLTLANRFSFVCTPTSQILWRRDGSTGLIQNFSLPL